MSTTETIQNTDSLLVLLVGNFTDSAIKQLFTNNFINIINAQTKEEAEKLLRYNPIDILLCDNNSSFDVYEIITQAKNIHKKALCMIATKNLNPEDLLMSIDLKIDAHLYEYDDDQKHYEQLNSLIDNYNKKRNLECFGKQYDDTFHKLIVTKTNEKGFITYANDTFLETTGYTREEVIGENHNIVRHKDNKKSLFTQMWDTISVQKKPWSGVIKNMHRNGIAFYAKSIIIPILDANQEVVEYLGFRINISKNFCDQSKLFYHIRNYDLSVLALVQIEGFDILEDVYSGGLLKTIEKNFGSQLLEHMPNDGLFTDVYFLGQGKYALHCDFYQFLQKSVNMKEYFDAFVRKVNESVLDIDYFEEDIQICLSFTYGKEKLYEDANYGLNIALKNRITLLDANDIYIKEKDSAKENKNIIKTIKVALDNSNIISYFQPIINNKTLTVEKYESLVRLIDEQNNILPPSNFLNIAKKSHFYSKITKKVLKNSFAMLPKINQDVTINMCMSDIEKKETMDELYTLLDQYSAYSDRLVIELLEDESVKNYHLLKAFIESIKQSGVKIAIDDFGSGYSNFERLMTLQPDIIKIDGSLIKNIEKDTLSRNLVETISFLSKKQEIKTVAEYVENENIYKILNEIGIDYSQGYFFGKPARLNCG